MKTEKSRLSGVLLKVLLMTVIALVMLIPLNMVKHQIGERERSMDYGIHKVAENWGGSQTISGPVLAFSFKDEDKPKTLAPDSLRYDINVRTQTLHRSIYDITVYNADVSLSGWFLLDESFSADSARLVRIEIDDLKGIEGVPSMKLGDRSYEFRSGDRGIVADLNLPASLKAGDVLPFAMDFKLKGSECLMVSPVGDITEVNMTSDCSEPSFSGEFLPTDREVTDSGFSAHWLVSQINRKDPVSSSFGVRMIQPVTQYRQTERSVKYGLLIIMLVFISGFILELVTKKDINLLQYVVIGCSLVLFYSLLLALSEFMAFGLSYLIAAGMTLIALGGYFLGILKDKFAYVLTALVALAYGVSYILLQMDTYAYLTGTIVLFVLLAVIMYFTKDLRLDASGDTSRNDG